MLEKLNKQKILMSHHNNMHHIKSTLQRTKRPLQVSDYSLRQGQSGGVRGGGGGGHLPP